MGGQAALRQIETGDRERCVREVHLEVAALGGEARQAASQGDMVGSGDGVEGGGGPSHQGRSAPGSDRRRRPTGQHRDPVATRQRARVESDVEVTEGTRRDLVGLCPDLLQRDRIAPPPGEPVIEAPSLRGTDPVDVGGGDAEHADETTCWSARLCALDPAGFPVAGGVLRLLTTVSLMHQSLRSVVLIAVLATGLFSCASTAETDWQSMQDDADGFVNAATAEDGSLGAATQRLTAQDPPPADDGGITLNFPSEVSIDGAVATCFGDGTAQLEYSVTSEEGSVVSGSVDILCDGGETEIPLAERGDAVRFSAVLVSGTGAVVAAAVSGGAE